MGTQVEASTIKAGQLFSTASFHVPDFQRVYSWTTADEVADFWNDLSKGIDSPPYFLGLLIMTDDGRVKTVVDGQQRIVTLTLLANSIRRAATSRGKTLVADSMRDVFLYAIDYATDTRSPRVDFASNRDRLTLDAVLEPSGQSTARHNDAILGAQRYLDDQLEKDLARFEPSARLGKWAHFLTTGITFAMFEHPDRSAAYKVFEIVNTRGKGLTPAELIKSFVIGSAETAHQPATYNRWTQLEDPFVEISADSQFTQFIRNVITLRHGYVEPRDLYEEISNLYEGPPGVDKLLRELESEANLYLQMVSPWTDGSDVTLRSFLILDALGLRTVRPIFMAVSYATDADEGFEALLKIILPRLVVGTFGTGSVERAFAEAAREVFATRSWRAAIARLGELVPSRSVFEERLATRAQNKGVLLVARAAALQDSAVPNIDGYVHQIRPRNAENWPDFSDEEFKELGGTIGNALIANIERRPRNSNSLAGAIERLFATAVSWEQPSLQTASEWTAEHVRGVNAQFATRSSAVWYA